MIGKDLRLHDFCTTLRAALNASSLGDATFLVPAPTFGLHRWARKSGLFAVRFEAMFQESPLCGKEQDGVAE